MGNKKIKENSGKQPKVVIVSNDDDWQGVYVNGELKHEGHEIPPSELLIACKIDHRLVTCDSDWLVNKNNGHLPEKLSDVKKKKYGT